MPREKSILAILFADVAKSTHLYEKLGNTAAQSLIGRCVTVMSRVTAAYNGTVIKTIGDEIMCTFPTAQEAVDAGKDMQLAMEDIPVPEQPGFPPPNIYVGIQFGPVISEAGDVFGDAVNVAARMVELAKSDQIITNKETLALMKQALKRRARIVDRTLVRGKDDIMEINELIWGKPEQMTMSNSFSEQMIASLTSEKDFLQIRYMQHRILVDRERPILTIGRGVANHLIVDDPLVSRMHARIELQRNRFMLIDQSTNGTFLKMNAEEPIFLRRDVIQLEGEGLIRLGKKIGEDEQLAVRYRIL